MTMTRLTTMQKNESKSTSTKLTSRNSSTKTVCKRNKVCSIRIEVIHSTASFNAFSSRLRRISLQEYFWFLIKASKLFR